MNTHIVHHYLIDLLIQHCVWLDTRNNMISS